MQSLNTGSASCPGTSSLLHWQTRFRSVGTLPSGLAVNHPMTLWLSLLILGSPQEAAKHQFRTFPPGAIAPAVGFPPSGSEPTREALTAIRRSHPPAVGADHRGTLGPSVKLGAVRSPLPAKVGMTRLLR